MRRSYSTSLLVAAFILAFGAFDVQADSPNLELASPKNGHTVMDGKRSILNMKLPPNWVRPYEPCAAVANYSNSKPDDIVLFIAGTLNGKGKWFYAISETLFSKADLTHKVDQLDDCIM
jgi:hypothetical protein